MKKNGNFKKEIDPVRREQEERLRAEIRLRRQCEARVQAAEAAERDASRVVAFLAGLASVTAIRTPEGDLVFGQEAQRMDQGQGQGQGQVPQGNGRSDGIPSPATTSPPASEAGTDIVTANPSETDSTVEASAGPFEPPGLRVLPEPGWQGTIELQIRDHVTICNLPASTSSSAASAETGEAVLVDQLPGEDEQRPPSDDMEGASLEPTPSAVSSTSTSDTGASRYRYYEDRFGSTDSCSFVVLIALFVYFIALPHLLPLASAQHFAPETWPDLSQRMEWAGTRPRRSPQQLSASTFTAYDCTVPMNVSTISFFLSQQQQSCDEKTLAAEQEQKEYVLLQKTRRIEITVQECIMYTSRLVYTCSAETNNHVSMAPREWFFNEPVRVDAEDCRKYFETKKFLRRPIDRLITAEYKWPNPRDITLVTNGTNSFPWERIGITRNANDDVYCVGGWMGKKDMRDMKHDYELPHFTWPVDNRSTDMKNVVWVEDVKLSLHKRKAYVDVDKDGYLSNILVDHNQLRLPCRVSDLNCTTTAGTYTWVVPPREEQCTYFKVRNTMGIDVKQVIDSEQSTFVATDGALVKLRKKGPQQVACGGLVQPTEFDRLFLTEDLENPSFQRPIPPVEHSQFLFSEVADAYVYKKVQDDISRAVQGIRKRRCQETVGRDVIAYARKLAETKAVADGDTAHLGKGLFVTAAGDGGYLYYCRPITVQARVIENKCYNALPVKLLQRDVEEYLYAMTNGGRTNPPEMPAFYLEPKTHRLITTAADNPCVKSLPPLYRNVYGKWMAYTANGLAAVNDPVSLSEDFQARADSFTPGSLDFNNHGLYTSDTIREIEIFVQARRASEAIPWKMENNFRDKHQQRIFDGGLSLGGITDFYYDVPGADTFGLFRSLEWFWQFLDRYGQVCSMIITTAILWRFTAWLIRVTMRLCSIPEVDNLCLHVANAFFPEWTEPMVKRAKRRKQQGAAGEELLDCCLPGRTAVISGNEAKASIEDDYGDEMEMERKTPLLANPPKPPPLPSAPLYATPNKTAQRVVLPSTPPTVARPGIAVAHVHGQMPYSNVSSAVLTERRRLLTPVDQRRLDDIQEVTEEKQD